jgi:hypothetical protein
MADPIGLAIRHTIVAACVTIVSAVPAAAQRQVVDAPPGPEFLSRYDFHLSAAALGSADDRFMWDTHWGGEFDFVDYVKGRLTFVLDYQAVLGNELQPFDPNQSHYILGVASSMRTGQAELVFVFTHVSRHLGDRGKTFGIAWNVAGGRVMKDVAVGNAIVGLRADAGVVTQRAYVDYSWTAALAVGVHLPVSERVAWFGRFQGETRGVDREVADRRGQRGGRFEAGVHVAGTRGALELFAGYEKVVDADPIDREPGDWAFAGFRLVRK